MFRFRVEFDARPAMSPHNPSIHLDHTGLVGRVLPVVVEWIDGAGRAWRLRHATWEEGERAVRALRDGSPQSLHDASVQEPVAVGGASEMSPEVVET
jgi:hypothetical protein